MNKIKVFLGRLKFCWRFLFCDEIMVEVKPLAADYNVETMEYFIRMRIDINNEMFYVDHAYEPHFIDDLFGKRIR